MAEPMLTIGKEYTIREGHPFWSGRVGVFEFMGGPDKDVVVLSEPLEDENQSYKKFLCVNPSDILLPLAAA